MWLEIYNNLVFCWLTFSFADYVVVLACIILVGLFSLQHYGTRKVGFMFAPIIIAWLLCISSIGVYNMFKWSPSVIKALAPHHMYRFLRKTGIDGWMSLGGVALCITGKNLVLCYDRKMQMTFACMKCEFTRSSESLA